MPCVFVSVGACPWRQRVAFNCVIWCFVFVLVLLFCAFWPLSVQ